ncbi:MAG: DUF5130 family protein [Rhodococcus sp. (in: high G+C Gram-positive bacteria)]|uniref:DUF5130 family protein n=1 Tax=Rhodococcus sp. EPR-157 TaxID=1813677 RepID=UPI0007BC2F83|nr:DUF5130 family protein [Rhodococcus sp. EPR-157]KZF02115.1 hypothetical protein A2J03_08835 [Rhodococcus sp. EPR-157]
MASGELVKSHVDVDDLPYGSALTSSGRVSAAHEFGTANPTHLPFATQDLVALDDALAEATRATQIRFNVYVGDLGDDVVAGANDVFPGTPDAIRSILIAVDPNNKAIEIRTGRRVSDRATDRVAQLGITAAVGPFRDGNLIDGLVSSIRVMAAAIVSP